MPLRRMAEIMLLGAAVLIVHPALARDKSRPAVQNGGMISDRFYPKESIQRGEEGEVTVQYPIDEKGGVGECRVAASSGSPLLDEASCAIVRGFTFKPALAADGAPVASMRQQGFAWRIKNACPPLGSGGICITAPKGH